jgi:methionine synthase II (cobalamin-independent)
MSVIIRQNKGSRRKHKVSQLYTPFRYDFVGSFLRPEYLKKARADYEAGTMSAEELKKTEDKAITELVAKQKEAGYHVITDGEFRRATWHLDFMWAFDGVGHSKTETGLPFHGEDAMIDDTYVTGKISYKKNHPFVEHFKFVKALEDENTVAKLTIPAPAQFLEQMIMPFAWSNTKKFYDTQEEVAKDIAEGYREFFKGH